MRQRQGIGAPIDVELARRDPAAVFAVPEDVLTCPLAETVKADILLRWAYDVSELEVAEEEGMPPGDTDLLQRIARSLAVLGVALDLEHSAPTKQHGFQERLREAGP